MLLLLALAVPVSIQFFHMLEGHHDISCNIKGRHLHQLERECKICDFCPSPLGFNLNISVATSTSVTIEKGTNQYSTPFIKAFYKSNTSLRAPPYFLM